MDEAKEEASSGCHPRAGNGRWSWSWSWSWHWVKQNVAAGGAVIVLTKQYNTILSQFS